MISAADHAFGPLILPLLGATLCFLSKAFLQKGAEKTLEFVGVFIGLVLPWVSIAALAPMVLRGGAVQGVMGGWFAGVGIAYRFDGLAWLVNILGYSVAGASWLYSVGAGPRGPAFSGIFLIQTAALAATVMTADLFNLFVCLEVLGVASYVLVASSDKPGASLAAFSYLLLSSTAMVFFLVGLLGFYRVTGTLSYEGIRAALQALPDSGGLEILLSLALITASVAMRVAVMPLYGWLPDAHAMAPHAISAVLSGVLIKTPLFALSRVLLLVPAGTAAGELMGYAGALTALVAVIIALSQKDAKRLLAYHSISQIGYVVAAWGAAIRVGLSTRSGITLMTAAFLHAFFHALFKGLLFLSVGTSVDRTGERDVYRLRGAARILRRTGERFPVTLLSFAVGALSISAIPPLNGFISKTAVSSALKDNPLHSLLYAAGIATVASFVKLSRIYWPKKDAGSTDETAAGSGRTTPAIWIPQIFLAALCVAGGVAVRPVYTLVFRIFSRNSGIALRIPEFYSSGNLGKALLVTAAGVLLFLLATTARGSLVMARIRNRPRSFQGLFTSFALGTAAMAAWLLI